LHTPITISSKNGIPKTTYTYLYIRKPDIKTTHIGDVDFYMAPNKYLNLKKSLLAGTIIDGISVFERPDLDLIRLFDSEIDVSSFIGQKTMSENLQFSS